MDNFVQRLKILRKHFNVTQKKVAESIGLSGRRYNDLEVGKSFPSADTLIKLADYFNVSTDYLLCRTDNPAKHTFDDLKAYAASGSEPLDLTVFERSVVKKLRGIDSSKRAAFAELLDIDNQ